MTSERAPAAVERPLIAVDAVSKSFPNPDGGRTAALVDISVEIGAREFVSVIGPSGCGKSTLLRVVGGLVRPTTGHVTIGEERISGPREDLAFVFQRPLLLEWMRIIDNVLLPATLSPRRLRRDRARALELLRLVRLEDFANFLPSQLSGGMQQRVAIARALLLDPKILLLDEPFGALDALTREQMNLELLKIWSAAEHEKSVLMVTHDIDEAVFLSDRIFVMSPRPGRIVDTVTVELPRPRTLDMRYSERFGSLVAGIRERLQESHEGA